MAYPTPKSQYDFSLFEMKAPTAANISTAPKKQPEPKKPQMKVIVNNKGKRKLKIKRAPLPSVERRTAKAGAVLLALMILFGASITQKVKLDEINREISRNQKTLEESKSETVRLQMQLNSIVSIEKVEDYAVNTLGMVKIETGQVEYIDLSDGDKVEVSGDKTVKKSDGDSKSVLRFLKFWEYLG